MDIEEVVKRVKKAFPEYEIGTLDRITAANSSRPLKALSGWRIGILEKDDGA